MGVKFKTKWVSPADGGVVVIMTRLIGDAVLTNRVFIPREFDRRVAAQMLRTARLELRREVASAQRIGVS